MAKGGNASRSVLKGFKMLTDEDKALWEAYTKTVSPLKKQSRLKSFGRKLMIKLRFNHKIEVPNTLDLQLRILQNF